MEDSKTEYLLLKVIFQYPEYEKMLICGVAYMSNTGKTLTLKK